VDRQWLYPYYVIAILALVLLLFGCDGEEAKAFSVEVQVENDEGSPVEGATVALRPRYDAGQDVWCANERPYGSTQAESEGKAVELSAWKVRADSRGGLLA